MGKVCKNCGGKLVVKQSKKTAAQLQKPYYYTAYYYCSHCKKLYHDETFRVVNQQERLFVETQKPPLTPPSQGEDSLPDKGGLGRVFGVDIWTDGACVHNGTPRAKAAWAFVSGETGKAGLVEGKQTNNVAEGLAIYHALKWAAEKGYKKIKLHTDSQISLFNLKKPARLVKMNREIFEDIEGLVYRNKLEVIYIKVLGHSGNVNNERADRLANTLAGR